MFYSSSHGGSVVIEKSTLHENGGVDRTEGKPLMQEREDASSPESQPDSPTTALEVITVNHAWGIMIEDA